MNIPFSPPFIDQSVILEVLDTLHNNWITTGPKVKALEQEIKTLSKTDEVICVNSWTSGAILMLKWFGIKAGDEVIVPAYTYCATALCVLHCGATPVLVDTLDDFNIDPEKVRLAITAKTKAIIAVDIAGWPCDYDQLKDIVTNTEIQSLFKPESEKQLKLNRILLISDAAHSIGSIYNSQPAAKMSDIAIFSFHAVKNITTAEGGAICLNLPDNFISSEEYKYLKMYTLNGQNKDALSKSLGAGWKYDILFQGLKINMPDICAAIGLAQIKKYKEELLPKRNEIALSYCKGFENQPWFICPPLKNDLRESCYHLFPLRITGLSEVQRDQVIDDLAAVGIAANVHFIPLPMLTYFKELGFSIEDYPISQKNYSHEISLPIYPQLTATEVDLIITSVISSVNNQLSNYVKVPEEEFIEPATQMAVAS